MTPLGCFTAKVKAGLVRVDLAQPLIDTITRLEKELEAEGAGRDALRKAAAETASDATAQAAREADLTVRTIEAQLTVLREVELGTRLYEARRAEGKTPFSLSRFVMRGDKDLPPIYHMLAAKLAGDRLELMPGVKSVFYEASTLRGQAHAKFRAGIETLRPTMAGLRRNTVAEFEALDAAFTGKGSPEALAAAKGASEAIEFLRQAFNERGGNIAKMENYVPNPAHNSVKVRTAKEDVWVEFVKKRLDGDKMVDFSTGQKLGPNKLDRLLRQVYKTIATDGRDGGPTSAMTGRGALARRHAEARVLHFKDAASWIEYDEKFGSGTGSIFERWMDHIEGMAHDAAMIDVLGPNPAAMQRFMNSVIDQWSLNVKQGESGQDAKAFKRNTRHMDEARVAKGRLNSVFDEITSANRIPVHTGLANKMSMLRDILVASRMGSALLSSFVDTGSAVVNANFNGLSGAALVADIGKNMVSKDFELTAAQMGFVADSAAMLVRQNDRYGGEIVRTSLAAKASNAVIAISGLRRWTETHRLTYGTQIMGTAANMRGRSFEELDGRFRAMFERHGIGRKEWDIIRSVEPGRYGALSGEFITGNEIRALGTKEADRIAAQYHGAVTREIDFAVLDYNPEVRGTMMMGTKPGTFSGEVVRTGAQFKGFGVNQIMTLASRIGAQGAEPSRMAFAAQAFITMTLLGMLSMQAKEIAKGRDPITMDPTSPIGARAWGGAILQGGGFGIFGDFLFQDQTRQGTSFASTLAGPGFGAAEKVLGDFLIGNVQRAAKGQETHFAGDALYAAAGFLPGSNLWYARAAFDKAVLDQLALMIDDRAPQRFQRIEREAQKNWGQSFWWEPGRVAPRRAPDGSAAFGGGP